MCLYVYFTRHLMIVLKQKNAENQLVILIFPSVTIEHSVVFYRSAWNCHFTIESKS